MESISDDLTVTSPAKTSPVKPSRAIRSPSVISVSPHVIFFELLSTRRSLAPATHGSPIPLATTAACEVIPPRDVIIPAETDIPPISSGLVSFLHSITSSSLAAHSSAALAVKTAFPHAPPGDALSPVVRYFARSLPALSSTGAKS